MKLTFWEVFTYVFYIVAAYYLILIGVGLIGAVIIIIAALLNKGRWY